MAHMAIHSLGLSAKKQGVSYDTLRTIWCAMYNRGTHKTIETHTPIPTVSHETMFIQSLVNIEAGKSRRVRDNDPVNRYRYTDMKSTWLKIYFSLPPVTVMLGGSYG